MKAKPKFKEFIQESEEFSGDEFDRLHGMGLEKLDPQEAWSEMADEWYGDPEVQAAVALLKQKLETAWTKWYRDEYEQDWEQLQEWIWETNGPIGTFDYFIISR